MIDRINRLNKKKSIVLIEDDEEMRENITEILELANYIVIPADSGEMGLELINEKHPDLIICDEMIPEVAWFGLLKKFRNLIRKNQTPFLFLTSGTDKYLKKKGYKSCPTDILMKPFNVEELLMMVSQKLSGTVPTA